MPQFEYECSDCEMRFTRLTSDRELDMVTCPECGGKSRRLMSVVHNTFGWRLDDQSHLPGQRDKLERDI